LWRRRRFCRPPFTRNAGSAAALLGFLQLGIGAAVSAGVGLLNARDSVPVVSLMSHADRSGDFLYGSANPRIPGFGLIDQSSLQAKDLEVTDDLDTTVAIAAAGRYSGLVGGAYSSGRRVSTSTSISWVCLSMAMS
jgi:hypothetical protein